MSRSGAESSTELRTQSPQRLPLDLDARGQLLAEMPVAERTVLLAGISTAVLEGGEGPPMILLHGPGEYAAKWFRVIPDLAKDFRVVAPDLPGHGASKPIFGEFDAAHILAWLDELIDATCEGPPMLVGQIIGGAIAARYAADRSERLRGLVLVDALGVTDFQPAREFGAALTGFISEPNEETHEELWQRCAYDVDTLRDRLGERWDVFKAYNLDRANDTELHATQQRLMELFGFQGIAERDLNLITVPTTLIWGRHDLATSVTIAEAASTRFGWPLHVIENAADDPPLEQPGAFLQALRSAESAAGGG